MTAQDLIIAAATDLKAISSGETPTTEELADGLVRLNDLLDAFSAQALPIPALTRDSLTLTGASSYTIGPSGGLVTVRPLKIRSADVSVNGMTVPIDILTAEQWAQGKVTNAAQYVAGWPNGTLYIRPAISAGSLEMWSYKPLTSGLSLSSNIDLPPGYLATLRLNLAVEMGPMFGRAGDPDFAALVQLANDKKQGIQGLNQAVLGPPVPPAQGA